MKIKACAYYYTEDDTCDFFKESHRGFYSFPSCECVIHLVNQNQNFLTKEN